MCFGPVRRSGNPGRTPLPDRPCPVHNRTGRTGGAANVVGDPLRPSGWGDGGRTDGRRWTAMRPARVRPAIATTDGRPERRYCTAAHRAAARQARRAALQTGQRDRPDPLAETLPWLREPADPARPTAEVAAPTEATAAEPAPATRTAASGPRDRRRPPGPRGRALAMLGVAGILAGGYAATDTQPEPSPAPVRATPEGETADAWAQRATVALTSVNRELDVLEQADEEWRQLPESRRAVVPPPVAALEERRSVLQRRRTTLQSQLDAYRSLRRAQQELAVSEQQLRAVEKALVDAPPERRRSAEQEAAIAALDEQRDLRLRRRDAQRAELASLQEGVSNATRAPLPDDGEATAKVSQDVREIVRNGGTTPSRPVDSSPPRPDVVAGREEEDGKPREEVGTSGPPDPRGPRDESEERRAGREEPDEQKRAAGREEARDAAPGPTAGPGDRPDEAGTGGAPDLDLRSAPAPSPAEPSAENEGDTSQDVLAELRDRAEQVAREARKAEAARTAGRAAVAHGEAPGKDDGSATRSGTSGSPERARRDAADRAVKPTPGPGRRMPGLTSGVRTASGPTRWMRPPCPPAARPPRPTSTSPRERRRTATPRNSGRRRGSEVRRSSSATSARIESRRTTDLRGPAPRPIPASCAGASIPGPRLGVRPRRRLTTTGPPRPQIQLPRGSDRRRGSGTRRTSDGRAAGTHRSGTTPRRGGRPRTRSDADDEDSDGDDGSSTRTRTTSDSDDKDSDDKDSTTRTRTTRTRTTRTPTRTRRRGLGGRARLRREAVPMIDPTGT